MNNADIANLLDELARHSIMKTFNFAGERGTRKKVDAVYDNADNNSLAGRARIMAETLRR